LGPLEVKGAARVDSAVSFVVDVARDGDADDEIELSVGSVNVVVSGWGPIAWTRVVRGRHRQSWVAQCIVSPRFAMFTYDVLGSWGSCGAAEISCRPMRWSWRNGS